MHGTFLMAIEALFDKSVRGALYDPSRAIDVTEGAGEDDGVVDGSSKKWPIPFLLGPKKRQKLSGEDGTAIDIASERKKKKKKTAI
jgi:hypothetical protein